jgi:hypothetical protein
MTLSSLAVKALIGFSLGLSANTAQSHVISDTLKIKKAKPAKQVKQNKLKPNDFAQKKQPLPDEISSCGKCGKG